MTGRTHDLAAATALNMAFVAFKPMDISLATAAVAIGANMIGGLIPDIDDATADIWDKMRGGNIIAKLIKPLIGQHRMFSHSILGMIVAGYIVRVFLSMINTILIVDMNIVWWALMIGYASHLITDSLTKQGVPWLFPIPIRFGFPPFEFMRMKTGGLLEKSLVFPGLILYNGYLIYHNYNFYLECVREFLVQQS